MKKYLVIAAIIILGGILRFNQLNNLPALNADEAAIGYNAYSLLQTGKDEHGHSWPIHFQSFNDYKPGLYFYLVLPFVKVMGLNEWAVRIPGALTGIATVFVVWLLVHELFPGERDYSLFTIHYSLPEIAALFLAISPWHIHFSRGGWEVNTATFFVTFGVWGLVRSVRNRKFLWVAVLSFAASLYTYHAARVVVPLLSAGLLFYYWRYLFNRLNLKHTLIVGVLGVILTAPLIRDLTGPAGLSRAAGVGLFADLGPYNKTNQQRGEHENPSGVAARLIHNKVVNYGIAFAQNYGKHFSGDFLFISGDEIQRNKVPEFGQMYLFDVLFLVVGFGSILKNFKAWFPVIWWLAFAPAAAALTFQSPHALRSENMVVPLVIISAFGAIRVIGGIREIGNIWGSRHFYLLSSIFYLLVIWDFSRYVHQYYFHMSKTYDYSSQYGAKELAAYVGENKDKYKNIVVTTRYDQPYVLFLFYLKYSPAKFQLGHTLTPQDKFGFSTVDRFDKYVFQEISSWDKIRTQYSNSLIAGTGEEIPPGANVIKTIYFPSRDVAYRVVAN